MDELSSAERALLFAVRLDDPSGLPLAAKTLLDRARTDWFPKFLSQGQLTPVFQPLVDLSDGSVYGREALIRGRMGKVEVRGQELLEAAEVHDALFSFDARARAAVLEAGLPILPEGELLFVKLDPRAVLDVESSLRAVWPQVERAGGRAASAIGLELMGAERFQDLELLAGARRRTTASRAPRISLDDLSVGTEALGVLEALKPDIAKLSLNLCKGIETSPARRHLVGALVEVAHELGIRVVAVGIERDYELEHIQELGIDLGQGFYLGAAQRGDAARRPRRWSTRSGATRSSCVSSVGAVPSVIATCSRTSSACGARWTSCSATSSAARAARGGFTPAVDVYYLDDPPRAVVRAELAGVDAARPRARDPRPRADPGRRAPRRARRRPRLPAARDRARPVPARRRARRRRRPRRAPAPPTRTAC